METKHTSSKTIITLYTVNPVKNIVYEEYKKWAHFWENQVLNSFKKGLYKKIKRVGGSLLQLRSDPQYPPLGGATQGYSTHLEPEATKINNITAAPAADADPAAKKKLLFSKYKYLTETLPGFNLCLRLYLGIQFKKSYLYKLDLLRKYQFNYYLNKFKFERNTYLHKLSNILSRIFNNNIEFNIINLKSVAFNPEIFTEILSLKLRKPKSGNAISVMNSLLKVANLPEVNRFQEKSLDQSKDWSFEKRYSNLSLGSILIKKKKKGKYYCPLNSLLKKGNPVRNISNIIFNSIKYKNLGGVRLEVKGRLTKRNRADRSQFKFKWKGGLKNIDSSYKSLSTVTYRGYYKPNVIYSLSQSKRRVGSFAVKGWISGK